jgi:hypothetical protein
MMRLEDGMNQRARYRGAMALRLVALCLVSGLQAPTRAQDAASAGSLAPPQAVLLNYRETGFSFLSSGLSFTPQTAAFRKEPDLGRRTVHRGRIEFGAKLPALAMVWDLTQGKLYLDLNRNNDLTDDPAGVYSARFRSFYQTFTNVQLTFNTPRGARRELVDLSLYANNNRFRITAANRSFWEGSVELQGQKWQVGLVQTLRGSSGTDEEYLVLRPWSARHQPFNLQDGSLDGFRFFFPKLFFGQRAYELDKTWVVQDGQPSFKIELKEMPVRTGELKLNGQHIHRLLLKPSGARTPYTVVLDNPGAAVKVPLGTYSLSQVTVKQGMEAHQSLSSGEAGWSVVISAAKPAVLACGGPLTNTVSATRYGRQLRLSYELVGAGGRSYELSDVDRSKPPQFAVYRGDKQVALGKFEFG